MLCHSYKKCVFAIFFLVKCIISYRRKTSGPKLVGENIGRGNNQSPSENLVFSPDFLPRYGILNKQIIQ